MFFSLLVPCLITIIISLCAIITITICARRYGQPRKMMLRKSIRIASVAFIPVLILINMIVNQFRYGTFSYATWDDIGTFAFTGQRVIPRKATDIMFVRTRWGYDAQFKISEEDLGQWYSSIVLDTNYLDLGSGDLSTIISGWELPSDIEPYGGYYSESGENLSIWYSESANMAYMSW